MANNPTWDETTDVVPEWDDTVEVKTIPKSLAVSRPVPGAGFIAPPSWFTSAQMTPEQEQAVVKRGMETSPLPAIGISPEGVQKLASKLPKPVQTALIPQIAVDKTIAGIADWATTPSGAAQLVAAGIPVTRIPVAIKFFHDMAKGAGESASNMIDAWKSGDYQGFADSLVGTMANTLGAGAIGYGGVKTGISKLKPSTTGAPNAIPEPSTGKLLQRPPEGIGETGSERGRVEPGQQGKETTLPQEIPPPVAPVALTDPNHVDPFHTANLTEHFDYSPDNLAKYQDLMKQFVGLTKTENGSAKQTQVWKDLEELRNRYNGNPPKQLLKPPSAPTETAPAAGLPTPKVGEPVPKAAAEVKPTPPAATAAPVEKVKAEVQRVARTEGQRPAKEVKSELVGRIEDAISKAKSESEWLKDETVKVGTGMDVKMKTIYADRPLLDVHKASKAGETPKYHKEYLEALERVVPKVEIDIPGDGNFKIFNTKEHLSEILQRAKRISTASTEAPKVKYRGISKEDKAWIEQQKQQQPPTPPTGSVGPGARSAEEQRYAALKQLSDTISVVAKESPKTDRMREVFDAGKTIEAAKDRVTQTISGLKAAGEYLMEKLRGYPVWTQWKAVLGDRHLALSESVANAKEFVRQSEKSVPDKLTQEAISNWMDTGGKDDLLAEGEAATKPRYKAGYAKARKLTEEQRSIASTATDYFSRRLQDAIDEGILEDGVENYIHRMYETDSPFRQAILSELRSGIFTGRPALAKQRVFQYDFEAEQAGKKPVKSFIKRIATYDLALNKAIADRQAVKAMTQIIMPDGKPMADVGGIGVKIEGDPEKGGVTLIRPAAKKKDAKNPANDRSDYKSRDYPALRRWKWVSADAEGNPIMVQGDVLIHPDAIKTVDALFKPSAVRQNPVGRAALALSSTVKQTMLDLSGFHPVQITVHGWEHRTFKPVEAIDFDKPDVRGLIRGGLVVGETTGRELFSEGLTGSSLTRHIPYIGEKLQTYNHWLFNDYIPRLKVATGLHALERNRERFPNMPSDELYHLTANQMNNAFGELNYEMIGRSKTTQDILRLALLAPDFLEARAGFVAQAATYYGREQFAALALGAATLYITARVINKLLDGEYHFEPKNAFSVVYNKKAYSLRTVQGDLLRAITEPGRFIYSRLNPTYGRTLMEFFSKRDAFGRQRNALQQLKDFGTTVVPISLRGLINPREQNLMESFMNAFGITEKRSTAAQTVFQLADNFKKANNIRTEPGEFVYDPDKDPYRGIKEAAVFSSVETTAKEIEKAIKAGHPSNEIRKHFTSYSNRPFTGSHKNDVKFVSELSDDNRKIYEDAVKERHQMIEKFNRAWELSQKKSAYSPGQIVTKNGRNWRVVSFDKSGEPMVVPAP